MGALTLFGQTQAVLEPGLSAALRHVEITLAAFDGQQAWLLRATVTDRTELVGQLWSSELGTLRWKACHEAPGSTDS